MFGVEFFYLGCGMELTGKFVNAETNKISATVIKLVKIFSIVATVSGWIIFFLYNFPELA
jgi:hypothetical protein